MRWKNDEMTGWGRAIRASSDIARPERAADLTGAPQGPAIGNRRSYGDAALNDNGRLYDMSRMDRFLSFDADTGLLTAEGGVTIGAMLRVFAPKGWMPPVMPGTGFATLGGAIAMDVHGKNHHHAGSFGQHLTDITLVASRGGSRPATEGYGRPRWVVWVKPGSSFRRPCN